MLKLTRRPIDRNIDHLCFLKSYHQNSSSVLLYCCCFFHSLIVCRLLHYIHKFDVLFCLVSIYDEADAIQSLEDVIFVNN